MTGDTLAPLGVRDTLANGLIFAIYSDPTLPATDIRLRYRAGSRYDPPGKSGYAHLVEHLMFEGGENHARGEYYARVEATGGQANARTEPRRPSTATLSFQGIDGLAQWSLVEQVKGECYPCSRTTLLPMYPGHTQRGLTNVAAAKLFSNAASPR